MVWLSMQEWYVPFDSEQVPLYAWQFRADNFEASVTMIWMCWCVVDIAVVVSYGGAHRTPIYRNLPVVICAALCHVFHIALIFSENAGVGCAFKVNCSKDAYLKLATSSL